ncbi:MAG: RNA polymerase sigma factor [Muribaculaceae bacterium]
MTLKEFENMATWLRPKLIAVSRAYFPGEELRCDAEDVVQDVLVKLWVERERLATVRNIEAWAVTMTKNMCCSRKRWLQSHATEGLDCLDVVSDDGDAAQSVEQSECFAQVSRLLASLPLALRKILVMRTVDHLSLDEIAAITCRPKASIKTTISKARKLMYQQLESSEK